MNEENTTAQAQWNLNGPDGQAATALPPEPPLPDETGEATTAAPPNSLPADTLKRRGFFEAIQLNGCPQTYLSALLKEHEQQAKEKMLQADKWAEQRSIHLRQQITLAEEQLLEIKNQILVAEAYQESADEVLQGLLQQKEVAEAALKLLQQKLMNVRIKLGEAKAGIVQRSLEDAEKQVQTALNIQKSVYDETKRLNQQKFSDEKDHLAQLAACYSDLYKAYEKRYQRVDKYLTVLDVDGISPVTTKVLSTIGTASFGAAGFFFSTFAGIIGFGNQDFIYIALSGFFETANLPLPAWLKVMVLLGLIALVALVSYGCNYLLKRLRKNSEEDIISEISLGMNFTKKLKQLNYSGSFKTNNWLGFLLQTIPAILIAGLIVLAIANSVNTGNLNAINASTEGLLVGTSIAISFAGLVYLYIIKVVEPRLVKNYEADPDRHVNWVKANWELVATVTIFLIFLICVVFVPFGKMAATSGTTGMGFQTHFAILIFAAICLVGGISFAYSVRSRGLIETGHYLEKVLRELKSLIAYCNGPLAPALHNEVAAEHSNIVQHVLKQLTANATLNKEEIFYRRKKAREQQKSWFERIFNRKEDPPPVQMEGMWQIVTTIQPWEENYFPHIVDELKAVEFEFREQKEKVHQLDELIKAHRIDKQAERQQLKQNLQYRYSEKTRLQGLLENVVKERGTRQLQITNTYNKQLVDLLDGFHMGLWYRENGLGPHNAFYEHATVVPTQPIAFISAQ